MKKTLFLIGLLAFVASCNNGAKTTEIETAEASVYDTAAPSVVKTPHFWTDSKGVEYPIFMNGDGDCFVVRTSGKVQSLGPDISKAIREKMK